MRGAEPGGEPKAAAVAGGKMVQWAELQPLLAEVAGEQVLEDVALDGMLDREMRRLGLELSEQATAQERSRLVESIAKLARVSGKEKGGEGAGGEEELLLGQVRRARGLGPVRFQALLVRNARLRALVRAEAGRDGGSGGKITEEDLVQALALKHGERVVARLIVVRSQGEAERVMRRLGYAPDGEVLARGEGSAPEEFARVAGEVSVDSTAGVGGGGRIGPLSPADPSLPVGVRRLLGKMQPGEVSVPVVVELRGNGGVGGGEGFAILKLEERIPGDGTDLETARAGLEAEIRSVRERAQMDRLARRLTDQAGVKVFDRSLGWSWEGRER